MVAKKFSIQDPFTDEQVPELDWMTDTKLDLPEGIALSDVYQVPPSELKDNPLNKEFFGPEDPAYFELLKEDIQKRGIIVSLIARKDRVLLAGKNRRDLAIEIGLKRVPVQYVQNQLSEVQETELLVKDNTHRRQLTGQKWIRVYKKLYPDFDEAIFEEKRGRSKKKKLTISKIAQDTGQQPDTVKKQIQTYKKQIQPTDKLKKKEDIPHPKSLSEIQTVRCIKDTLKHIPSMLKQSSATTIHEALTAVERLEKKLKDLLKKRMTWT